MLTWFRKLFLRKNGSHSAPLVAVPTPPPPAEPSASFDDFNFHEKVRMGIDDLRFTKPTPIQEKAIPIVLDGKDIIACAQTGTGKTAAFLLPILEKLSGHSDGVRALVLTPTRELAQQIEEQFTGLAYHTGLTSVTVVGGVDATGQERGLRGGSDVVVATPGRLIDHMRSRAVDFSKLKFLVIDEADRMHDMGFLPDLNRIILALPKDRQTLMFSATMPPAIQQLVKESQRTPVTIRVGTINRAATTVAQRALFVDERRKYHLLREILREQHVKSALVFTNTRRQTHRVFSSLLRDKFPVEAIHGNRTQEERMEALNLFKSGQIRILIATDVAARGIDVTGITHVINYDTPLSPEEYIHRIGRTGRAEFEGAAITFVSDEEYKQWVRIKDKIKATFELESTSFASRPAPQGQQVRQHGQAPHRAGSGGRPRQQQHGRRHGRQR